MENTLKTPVKQSTKVAFSHLTRRAFTQEDREVIAEKRKAHQEWAESNLKLDWLDEGWMREIAHSVGLKLALWYYPASTTKYIKRALKAVGRDGVWHKEVFGFPIGEWNEVNPEHPAWVAQCLIVEQHMIDKGVL